MTGSKQRTRSPSPVMDSCTEPPDSDFDSESASESEPLDLDSDSESGSDRDSESEPTSDSDSSVSLDDEEQIMRFFERRFQENFEREFPHSTVPPEMADLFVRVLVFLSTQILELSVNIARNRSDIQTGVIEVTEADYLEAVESDPALKELFEKVKMARNES